MFVATAYEPAVSAIRYVAEPGPSSSLPRRASISRRTTGQLLAFAHAVRAAVAAFASRTAGAASA